MLNWEQECRSLIALYGIVATKPRQAHSNRDCEGVSRETPPREDASSSFNARHRVRDVGSTLEAIAGLLS